MPGGEGGSAGGDGSLASDTRRAVILGTYVRLWGVPETRVVLRREADPPIEIYRFPAGDSPVARLATCGLSAQARAHDLGQGWELLLTLPPDWGGGGGAERASRYLADLATRSLGTDVRPRQGTTTRGSRLAPEGWPPALLLDEPLGEPEELAVLHVGSQHVEILWVIPVFAEEADRILVEGPDWLHHADDPDDLGLPDVHRRSRA